MLRVERASRALALALLLVLGSAVACQSSDPSSAETDRQGAGGSATEAASTGGTAQPTTNSSVGVVPNATASHSGEEVCEQGEAAAELVPTNLLFVVDKSGSMNCNAPPLDEECLLPAKEYEEEPSKWEITRAALVGTDVAATADVNESGVLRTLVDTPGLSAGLITFPIDSRCAILPSGELNTAIALLDGGQANALAAALEIVPDGETPLAGAAIRGLDILRAQLVAGQLSGHSYLVLMTDGVETCQPDALEDLKIYVTQALEYFDVRTYVIGAPGSADSRALLSEIAQRGGTASASGCQHGGDVPSMGDCHIDLTESTDFAGDLLAVFSAIAQDTQASCDFDVPEDAFVDPGKVNVVFTSGDAQEETFLMDDRDCETEADGWQYTSEEKEKIVLCGTACQRVRSEPQGSVRVVFRCRDTEIK